MKFFFVGGGKRGILKKYLRRGYVGGYKPHHNVMMLYQFNYCIKKILNNGADL